ncbi:MAG: DEAD/DEAH box helicase, partial [Gemmatimonadetes bacterium]|nr:DEAD/DEAH box helicase [Gemmatimonadota bacterium]
MLVEVALPLPIPRPFTYRIEGTVAEGTRVLVPFGRRRLVGWVVGEADTDAAAALRAMKGPLPPGVGPARPDAPKEWRAVLRVLEDAPSIPPELFRLCQWVADYYLAPLGQVLRSALPAVLSHVARAEGGGPPVQKRRVVRLTLELPSLQQRDELFGRAQRQRDCYELLETMGGAAELARLTGELGFSAGVVKGLVEKRVAAVSDEEIERDPFATTPPPPPGDFMLTEAQRAAVSALVAAANPGPLVAASATDRLPFLLRGVTGSGKTQVYIELLKEVVKRQGRGAIVLVPEIALTPQTVARFRAHFGDLVAVLHSALSDGERYDAWRALRSGARRIAVGARSAVFAPVPELGAIVVDEEHETTYKQSDEAPRYHTREVAIVRAGLAGAVCVLGSATPSLESWYNATIGKYRLLELPERVEGRSLPPVRIVDLRRRMAAAPGAEGAGFAQTERRGAGGGVG